MFAAIVNIALSVIGIAIFLVCAFVRVSMTSMSYITGFCISAILTVYCVMEPVEAVQGVHPLLLFLVILGVTEGIICLLVHIPPISRAVRIVLSAVMIAAVAGLIFDSLEPDSIQFCVFVTLGYLMVTGFLLFTNAITNDALTVEQTNQHGIAGRIISIGIYAAAAYMIAAVPIELIWLRYLR